MIECAIPQDILKYKAKIVGNFSAREAVGLASGIIVGLGAYFTFLSDLSMDAKMYISAFLMVPFFLLGFLNPMGQPLEKYLGKVIYDNFICPSIRRKEVKYPEYELYKKEGHFDAKGKPIKIKKSKEYKAIK